MPSIRIKYFARGSVSSFCRKALSDGYWVTYPALSRGTRFAIRHFVPLIFTLSLLGLALLGLINSSARILFGSAVALYSICAIGASVFVWRRAGSPRLVLATAAAFGIKHVLYGCGSVMGIASWIASFWPLRHFESQQ